MDVTVKCMTMVTPSGRSGFALALSGCASIAVAFGFARYGFGLFVPAFEREFGLATTTVGAIGSVSYAAYLGALLGTGMLTARFGPRVPVVLGNASAMVGTALVAVASSSGLLVAGLVLAASSSGWTWAPFGDAVARQVPSDGRSRALSVVSTGTTFGLMIAGPLALLTAGRPDAWRMAWGGFAGLATLALVVSLRVVPHGRPGESATFSAPSGSMLRGSVPLLRLRGLLRGPAAPLFLQAALYGVVASAYYTFAVDLVRDEGLDARWSSLLWLLVGVGGISGLATGEATRLLGLGRTLALSNLVLAGAIAALAVVPSSALGAGLAACVFGFAYMPIAALLSLWNQAVHPRRPTTGMTLVFASIGAGSIPGAVAFGALADAVGLRAAFLLLAAVPLIGLAFRPSAERSHATEPVTVAGPAAGVTTQTERRYLSRR